MEQLCPDSKRTQRFFEPQRSNSETRKKVEARQPRTKIRTQNVNKELARLEREVIRERPGTDAYQRRLHETDPTDSTASAPHSHHPLSDGSGGGGVQGCGLPPG